MNANFDDSAWPYASSRGANGVGPWGDVNREMGAVDNAGLGIWQGFSEQFPGPHIWTATTQDYGGQMIATPNSSPQDQDWTYIEYVFPSVGIWSSAGDEVPSSFIHGGGEIGANPVRFIFESFGWSGACDSTWVDDISVIQLPAAGNGR
jgi:hypothetical protein